MTKNDKPFTDQEVLDLWNKISGMSEEQLNAELAGTGMDIIDVKLSFLEFIANIDPKKSRVVTPTTKFTL